MTKRSTASTDKSNIRANFNSTAVIINMAAGRSSDISEEVITIFERFNYPKPTIQLVEPSELAKALETIKRGATDLLVIYGGDGTCKSGAMAAREAGIPLIALPGGTMNMLPKALYGTDKWQDALELALSQSGPRWQVGGLVNERIFFCGAIIGDPITMSEARESLRDGEIIEAVKHLPDIVTAIAHGDQFEFKVDGKLFETQANGLQIYCPSMTKGATNPGAFELASVPQLSIAQVFGIGARALTQDWRDSVHVKTAHAQHVSIYGNGAFEILLDGESETVKCPIDVKFETEGVRVLAPNLDKVAT